MGKKSAAKDRGYLTATEWKTEWGGHKGKKGVPFKRLPFHCCAITFTPFEEPVCTDDGTVYDVTNIVPYVMKYKRHPVTGAPLALRDLVKLNFHKNAEGMFDCPITGKVFTEHTHIAAVKSTGNVYAWEALDELNIKPKNWRDLLTEEPFTRKDIIHIQDPLNLQGRTVEQFDHVQRGLVLEAEGEAEGGASNLRNMTEDMKRALGALQTGEAKAAFEGGGGGKRAEALRLLAAAKSLASGAKTGGKPPGGAPEAAAADSDRKEAAGGEGDWRLRAPERQAPQPHFRPGAVTWDTEDYTTAAGRALKKKEEAMATMVVDAGVKGEAGRAALAASRGPARADVTPAERYEAEGHVAWEESGASSGQAAAAFTSSSAAVHTKSTRQMRRKQRNPTKKGYVRLHTTLGDLNLELHCDITPRTCENFIALCGQGYYDGTLFHRSIKNFMVQGGDPTGTGLGGESIYGKTFPDEVDSRLDHSGRGALSMANSGKDTNGSQFFITYKSCRHLDRKHTVFGRVVGGLEVLTAMERVDTDEDDRPKQEIRITGVTVFTNPYQEMEDAERAATEAAAKAAALKQATADRSDPAHYGKWFSAPAAGGAAAQEEGGPSAGGGVGKYLNLTAVRQRAAPGGPEQEGERGAAPGSGAAPPAKKPKLATKPAAALTNFDAW